MKVTVYDIAALIMTIIMVGTAYFVAVPLIHLLGIGSF